jgi:hypothetical protein
MQQPWFVAACILGAVGAGYLRTAFDSKPAEAQQDTTEQASVDMAELRAELRRLRSAVENRDGKSAARSAVDPSALEDGDSEGAAATPVDLSKYSGQEIERHDREVWRQFFGKLDGHFAGEGVDAAFAADSVPKLDQAVQSLPANLVTTHRVECRSDTCKTTLEHSGPLPLDMLMYFTKANGALGHYVDLSEHRSVVYSVRVTEPED